MNSQVCCHQPASSALRSTDTITASGNAFSARTATTRMLPSTGLSITSVPAWRFANTSLNGGSPAKLVPMAASMCGNRASTVPSR